MFLDKYEYNLPEELIANRPIRPRDSSRLLIVNKKSGKVDLGSISDLPNFFSSNDLAIFNNTKVLPIVIKGSDTNNLLREFLLIENVENNKWKVMTKSPKKTEISFQLNINAKLLRENKKWFLIFDSNPKNLLKNYGLMPIPPYLKRESDSMDLEDYQTVFASIDGSIAAPTAGLHFTKKLLDNFKISKDYITLHVGLGTFLPVKSENVDDHIMHEESFFINNKTLKKIQDAKRNRNRILSIGTTSLRAIESLAIDTNQVDKWSKTNLFITEGFDFQFTDCLLTNFHLPKSTLLILISSFLGYELTMKCYKIALEEKFRFYSYGDAMLIL
ncbi:tRNA preQ1(34) S-adenosylmethionine ribosyltransferase-isomerase QueA [bacterium]|nr:tRNA preQ1(34) S-adenosylmethionine ribosyltransferase-isomerase QueA [bacterium]|tara:strand:+ start:1952 stop:2941 length:990 start_codon:yes stop_codon:yes gene_type:complete